MFFFPISDINATKNKPVISWTILISCIFIFLYQKNLSYHLEQKTILIFGMIPSVLFNIKQLSEELSIIPSYMTLISSMFLHGGWMHLIGNMAYLYIFGDNIEDELGKLKFIFFYIFCGIFAGLSQALIDINSEIPMIGASGAISGILGAYIILFPKKNIKVFFWFFIFIKIFKIPAMYVIGCWIIFQFFSLNNSEESNIAYVAHIAGFTSGIILIFFLRKKVSRNRKKITKGSLPNSS
ncbi:rhomboid family intramembrane serine protease [Alphaproteobacteria bacterium]|nr:rhomboid family intramembrane serine protease [Alphaproteobacteria bacterium]